MITVSVLMHSYCMMEIPPGTLACTDTKTLVALIQQNPSSSAVVVVVAWTVFVCSDQHMQCHDRSCSPLITSSTARPNLQDSISTVHFI